MVAALLVLLLAAGCGDAAERCAGNIEVLCDSGGLCTCADGAFTGEDCVDLPNSTDPDACENKCCGTSEGTGPGSVLQGTAR